MISHVDLDNFGPLHKIRWPKLGAINLIIGNNGSGKTFLLKAIYSALKTVEEHGRGNTIQSAADILANKLYWTFQVDKIGDLVTKKAGDSLKFNFTIDKQSFHYSFGKDTAKKITNLESKVKPRSSNSIFLPAKEVLSLHNIILDSRVREKIFGFDDTYFDLAQALAIQPQKGRNYEGFSKSRLELESLFGGKVVFESTSNTWVFKKGSQQFSLGVTAEGVKKIAILDTLLGNRYLDRHSVIFMDEPESALHPTAISKLLDIIAVLAEEGIQIFMASHSYFVVKKLFLIAQQKGMNIPVLAYEENEDKNHWRYADLREGFPDNPIVEESIRLYEQEVALSLGQA
ncbi:MAG: AAA family ATPase [Candidatus Methylacidiphilales bacterium]|nr:AAA family ATPase [Candidatus Methylacidiphilales bacterium]